MQLAIIKYRKDISLDGVVLMSDEDMEIILSNALELLDVNTESRFERALKVWKYAHDKYREVTGEDFGEYTPEKFRNALNISNVNAQAFTSEFDEFAAKIGDGLKFKANNYWVQFYSRADLLEHISFVAITDYMAYAISTYTLGGSMARGQIDIFNYLAKKDFLQTNIGFIELIDRRD